jgi:hypothetical protein
MQLITKWAWAGAIIFGIVLVGAGLFMVREARSAHDEVRDTLASERVVSSEDSDLPLVPVTGPEEAKAQANAIKAHML